MPRPTPDTHAEAAAQAGGAQHVAGVDEAGRGPLAGPVVAAAVVLMPPAAERLLDLGLDDSKKMPPARRQALFQAIDAARLDGIAMVGIGAASIADILRLNILHASMAAMTRAVAALPRPPDHVLVDGNRLPALACPAEALVRGDSRSVSIAAASVVAKVVRDRAMAALARRYPAYGWERNAGYGTAEHLAALRELGPTPHHRQAFAPVRQLLLEV